MAASFHAVTAKYYDIAGAVLSLSPFAGFPSTIATMT
jgi:hypothetical protein